MTPDQWNRIIESAVVCLIVCAPLFVWMFRLGWREREKSETWRDHYDVNGKPLWEITEENNVSKLPKKSKRGVK